MRPAGKGAFFKPHVDTPRSQNMFGSLVIVFPSPHGGGELVLRQEGKEWTFDAAQLLAGSKDRIAYIAFFSDIEHEVLPVRSGRRVTITYNLYSVDDQPIRSPQLQGLTILQPVHANVGVVKDDLEAFLHSVAEIPYGALGFGLRHFYALPSAWDRRSDDPLDILRRNLKGSDAALFHACKELGLQPKLLLVAKDEYGRVMLDHMKLIYSRGFDDDDFYADALKGVRYENTRFPLAAEDGSDDIVNDNDGSDDFEEDSYDSVKLSKPVPVYWVTGRDQWNRKSQPYATYCGSTLR